MPQSKHRKITKAKKRPRGQYPAVNATSSSSGRGSSNTTQTVAIIVVLLLVVSVVGYVYLSRRSKGVEVTTPSGLKYTDLVVGTGASPQIGQTVSVLYTGTLEKNGKKFESSYDRVPPAPSDFVIGVGKVIKGWDEGLMTMKVGGKRRLIVPPKLGYDTAGTPKIPANSTLIFDIELVGIK